LFIKRDDLTGLALGGNKTRKLEYLVRDALSEGADTILTAGAAQSNHCRQTAAAAARAGLRCVLILGGEHGSPPTGNLLLDELFGAEIHWTGMERRGERMQEIAETVRRSGGHPYVIPYGGSNGVGAQGYVDAMVEAVTQCRDSGIDPDVMIAASSSGGTQAGLVLGGKLADYHGEILGISIDKGERGPERFEVEMAQIARAAAAWRGASVDIRPEDFHVAYGYLGGGYGVMGDLERNAIRRMAMDEGILLDPVYTGRAFGAMAAMILRGELTKDQSVLFWHTGGAPSLFAYAGELTPARGSEGRGPETR
jgi:D-cysteine desulfhydrase